MKKIQKKQKKKRENLKNNKKILKKILPTDLKSPLSHIPKGELNLLSGPGSPKAFLRSFAAAVVRFIIS